MEQYSFSNKDIDLACEKVGAFLTDAGVERREAIRIKLAFEEVLLEYQARFGQESKYQLRCGKRFSAVRVEIIAPGESWDPTDKGESQETLVNGLLAGMGIAPAWSYKNGRNYVVFMPKKKPLSQTVKTLLAVALSIVTGYLLTLLPDGIRIGLSQQVLSPVTGVFMGLISAIAGPLVFLSVLSSICTMGNMDTFGKIGKKTIMVIVGYMSVICLGMTLLGVVFYNVESGGIGSSDFSQILNLIYDIVPTNLVDPFLTGNALQIIFIALIFGIAMLVLASKVSHVFTVVEQLSVVVQTVMSGLSAMLPAAVFIIFTDMIASGNLNTLLGSWKTVVLMLLVMAVYLVAMVLWIAARKKVSPILLAKKALPTFMICLTTASSAAAFSTNVSDANKKLGIDKKLVEFGTPLGQVLYMPGFVPMLCIVQFALAEANGIPITPSWLILGYITNLLLTFAVPPIPGGALMGYTIAFAQLGIPMEAMGVAVALNSIMDFPGTATNVTGWQLTLIDVADSLKMLDREVLQRAEASKARSTKG